MIFFIDNDFQWWSFLYLDDDSFFAPVLLFWFLSSFAIIYGPQINRHNFSVSKYSVKSDGPTLKHVGVWLIVRIRELFQKHIVVYYYFQKAAKQPYGLLLLLHFYKLDVRYECLLIEKSDYTAEKIW